MTPEREAETPGASLRRALAELAKLAAIVAILSILVRMLLFQPFDIPSGSLEPTVLIGDYLLVSKYAYGYSRFSFPFGFDLFHGRTWGSPPRRGEVAVFKLPIDQSTDYIKRIIGLPGEDIQLRDARLYIDGRIVPREPVAKIITTDEWGREVAVPTYREILPGGISHLIIQREGDTGFYSNTPVYHVPPGQYFVMGDNRDNSSDSRVSPEQGGVGFVPLENFVGRAEIIFFSMKTRIGADGELPESSWQFWRWPWTVRWSRIFQRVQ
jgi:signal peptidase I